MHMALENTHTYTKAHSVYAYTVVAINTHTPALTHTHTCMQAARKDVWRQRTPAISSSILPACSGCPSANLLASLPASPKSKCQTVTSRGFRLLSGLLFVRLSGKRGILGCLCGIQLLQSFSLCFKIKATVK